jgi:hypothetical protein
VIFSLSIFLLFSPVCSHGIFLHMQKPYPVLKRGKYRVGSKVFYRSEKDGSYT